MEFRNYFHNFTKHHDAIGCIFWVFVRCSCAVLALFVRCSCAFRALFVRCSCAFRALVVRCSCFSMSKRVFQADFFKNSFIDDK